MCRQFHSCSGVLYLLSLCPVKNRQLPNPDSDQQIDCSFANIGSCQQFYLGLAELCNAIDYTRSDTANGGHNTHLWDQPQVSARFVY
jgi:hypothetical protein